MITENISNNIGLALNAVGTLLIAFSFGKFPKDFGGSTSGENGKEYPFSYLIHPLWFKFGVSIALLGFIIQLSFVNEYVNTIFLNFII